MKNFYINYRTLIPYVAYIASIISLFFVSLAALASRKQNILKTAPLFNLEINDDRLKLLNLNSGFAYELCSEPFIHISRDTSLLSLYKPSRYVYTIKLCGKNYIETNEESRYMDVLINGKKVETNIGNYFFGSLLSKSKKGEICLFFKDSQSKRFITRIRALHDDSTINNRIYFNFYKPATYLPWYRLDIWVWYLIRSIKTYFYLYFKLIKDKFRLKS